MIRTRVQDTVRVTKVKGHATDADVEQGRIRPEDRLGNAEADTAADLGRRHQRSWSWMLGVLCSIPVIIGIPSYLTSQIHDCGVSGRG